MATQVEIDIRTLIASQIASATGVQAALLEQGNATAAVQMQAGIVAMTGQLAELERMTGDELGGMVSELDMTLLDVVERLAKLEAMVHEIQGRILRDDKGLSTRLDTLEKDWANSLDAEVVTRLARLETAFSKLEGRVDNQASWTTDTGALTAAQAVLERRVEEVSDWIEREDSGWRRVSERLDKLEKDLAAVTGRVGGLSTTMGNNHRANLGRIEKLEEDADLENRIANLEDPL